MELFNTEGLDRNMIAVVEAMESCFGKIRKVEDMFVEAEFPMTPDGRRGALKVRKLRVAENIEVLCNGWRVRVNVRKFKMKKWTLARVRRLVKNYKEGLEVHIDDDEELMNAFCNAAVGILELHPEVGEFLRNQQLVEKGYEPDFILRVFLETEEELQWT